MRLLLTLASIALLSFTPALAQEEKRVLLDDYALTIWNFTGGYDAVAQEQITGLTLDQCIELSNKVNLESPQMGTCHQRSKAVEETGV